MPRLLRPSIPIIVRCRVVLRQLGEMFPDQVIRENMFAPRDHRRLSLGRLLAEKLIVFAATLNCEVKDLHLDHDPALAAREKVFKKGKHVGYIPDANDPEYLYYREAAAHRVKTNVRGLHGQHPDRVLIKKQRRRERAAAMPRRIVKKIAGRPMSAFKATFGPKKKFKAPSRWPAKGTRKVNWRKKR